MSKPYKPITGNPRRKTKESTDGGQQSSETSSDEKSSTEEKSASNGSTSTGRKRRVAVTPQDPEVLEAISENFGLPRSKVYNLAFKALVDKLEHS
jgi:hypothetical protein